MDDRDLAQAAELVTELVAPRLAAIETVARLLLSELHRRDPVRLEAFLESWQAAEAVAQGRERRTLRLQIDLALGAIADLPG